MLICAAPRAIYQSTLTSKYGQSPVAPVDARFTVHAVQITHSYTLTDDDFFLKEASRRAKQIIYSWNKRLTYIKFTGVGECFLWLFLFKS